MLSIDEDVPKVSVCVVTYNQANYIEQCLQSLVDQEVDFSFEVIVSDDCSTDGTSAIVTGFADKYPGIVRAFIHKQNIGPYRNFLFVHELATGLYIAHMDGDDYSLPGKLARQVEFLDDHPECAMVFHRCLSLISDGKLVPSTKRHQHVICNFAEFIYRYPSSTWHSAKMYRRSSAHRLQDIGPNFIDKHLHFGHGLTGLVGFLNEDLGVYRVGVGISSNIFAIQDLALDSYHYAIRLGYDKALIHKIIAREHFEQGLRALQLGDQATFRNNVKIGFESGHRTASARLAYFLVDYPALYTFVRDGLRWLRGPD